MPISFFLPLIPILSLTSLPEVNAQTIFQEEIAKSQERYKIYENEMRAQNKEPAPDYMTNMLIELDQELSKIRENERLKEIFLRQLHEKKLKEAQRQIEQHQQ